MNLLMRQSKLKLNIVGAVAWHTPTLETSLFTTQEVYQGVCVCVEMLSFKKPLKTRQSRNARKEYAHATFQLGSSSDSCCGVVGIGQTPMK